MLRIDTHRKFVDNFESRRVDYRNIVGLAVGHVNTREMLGYHRAELAGASLAVEIVGINYWRHAGDGLNGSRRFRGADR